MKITIDFDATPDEARRFFGLPDVAPMQEALIAEMSDRLRANIATMDPEALWRQWMPSNAGGGVEAMRSFWEQAMQSAMGGGAKKP